MFIYTKESYYHPFALDKITFSIRVLKFLIDIILWRVSAALLSTEKKNDEGKANSGQKYQARLFLIRMYRILIY